MASHQLEPETLSELCSLPVEELTRVDIGRTNLLCAEGLVGSEGLDVPAALRQLDEMAQAVVEATRRYWPKFQNDTGQFENSEAHFCTMVLITVLQRDFGVTYDVGWFESPPDFTDSRSVFIHGILSSGGGTCSSLPVLYAAVGRRLGYPLKLVSSVSHLFLRWDDPANGDRFNIETTSRGLVCHPDEHYQTWPNPMRPEDIGGSYYLSPYTPQQELACFLITRAQCFFDWYAFDKAMQLAHKACELFPEEPNFRGLHAIATVLYRQKSGLATYDLDGQVVVHHGVSRAIEPWERWACHEAEKHLERLRAIHDAKQSPAATEETDAAFAALNA